MVFADKPIDPLEPLNLVPEAGDFISKAGVFERVLYRQFKFIEVDRLDQVVESAALYCHDNVFYLLVRGYHDNRRGRAQLFKAGQQFETASVGESDIEQNKVGFFALGKFEPAFSGIGFQDDMCLSQEPARSRYGRELRRPRLKSCAFRASSVFGPS